MLTHFVTKAWKRSQDGLYNYFYLDFSLSYNSFCFIDLILKFAVDRVLKSDYVSYVIWYF